MCVRVCACACACVCAREVDVGGTGSEQLCCQSLERPQAASRLRRCHRRAREKKKRESLLDPRADTPQRPRNEAHDKAHAEQITSSLRGSRKDRQASGTEGRQLNQLRNRLQTDGDIARRYLLRKPRFTQVPSDHERRGRSSSASLLLEVLRNVPDPFHRVISRPPDETLRRNAFETVNTANLPIDTPMRARRSRSAISRPHAGSASMAHERHWDHVCLTGPGMGLSSN